MALVDQVKSHQGQIDEQGDLPIPMDVTIGTYNGDVAIRIGSNGSANRQTKPKPSQVYVLDENRARQLYNILKSTFRF